MALYRNKEEIHMAVSDITQYELVPAPEFPGTGGFILLLKGVEVRARVAVF